MLPLSEALAPVLPLHLRQMFGPALPPAQPTPAEREELRKLRSECTWHPNQREVDAMQKQDLARRRMARIREQIARREYPIDYMAPHVTKAVAVAYAEACDEFVRECAAGITRPNLPFSPL